MPATAVRSAMPSRSTADHASNGATLVAADGRALPLRAAALTGRLCGGLGRIVVEQTFVNPHAEPLSVTYQLPIPQDAAVSGFSFRVDGRVIAGEVDRKGRARERYEEAIAQGRTAAHLEQERGSLFTQEVGNIKPGATLVARIELDQRLVWIDDASGTAGGWEWRFPTVVAPRYLAEPGRVDDADRVQVTTTAAPRPITMSLAMTIADAAVGSADSPSHAIATDSGGVVTFAAEHVGLDRDVVLRWPVSTPTVGLSIDVARPSPEHRHAASAYGLVTLVPPSITPDTVARDLIVLLDTSGSMNGEPLEQSKRIAAALIDGLRPDDTIELIEFSSRARKFCQTPKLANAEHKADAKRWVGSLRAGGGTEMVTGVLAALDGVRAEAQRQVILVTDGLIGFERDVVAAIVERLPSGSRLHTVGVGSAVNRSLLGPAARAGRGVEVIVGIGEDPERATKRLLARTADPVIVDLEIEGSALHESASGRLPDLYASSPALVSVRLAASGGELRVRGRTHRGTWQSTVQVRPPAPGMGSAATMTLFAREQVEDLELLRTAGADQTETDASIEALGLGYQIATRLTSWVAISDHVDVDPADPTRRQTVPQQVPHGMSVEGLGLRSATAPELAHAIAGPAPAPAAPGFAATSGGAAQGLRGQGPGGPPPSRRSRGASRKRKPQLGGNASERGDQLKERREQEATLDESTIEAEEALAADDAFDGDAFDGQGAVHVGARAGSIWFGTLRSHHDARLIIEVTAPVAWQLSHDGGVTVTLDDGTIVRGRLVTGTTRGGPIPADTVVRLVVELDNETDRRPAWLDLVTDGRQQRVSL